MDNDTTKTTDQQDQQTTAAADQESTVKAFYEALMAKIRGSETKDEKKDDAKDETKEENVILKKADYDALMANSAKINDVEKLLQQAQTEKQKIKFESLKQKHGLTDEVCGLLGITVETKEEDVAAKVETFAKLVGGVKKDNAAFLKTDTTKAGTEDKIAQLIKDGKVTEALALKLK